jgi:hypothetical protein
MIVNIMDRATRRARCIDTVHREDIGAVNNAAEQAPVSARDVRAPEQSFEIARGTATQPFAKMALKVLLVLLPGHGGPNSLISQGRGVYIRSGRQL